MKKIIGILLAVCLVFSCAACGGGEKKPYASVEEFVQSEEVQQQVQKASEQYQADGLTITASADGDKLVFTYAVSTQIDAAATIPALEMEFDAQASSFTEVIQQMREQIDVENPSIVLRYVNADGSEILSREFTGSVESEAS
ncbi:DUF4854 domain-containing protein [Anaeromassilibacillus sp. An200]|uniref:DUF4854 domain-containing protein n=1 Tax=Anaeromassilibacillus sp. An200 TaxID=1965587 RepID=UPI000B3A9878|nr:DUF4854 domain-containing protein [Anaeromassilibacillus sp. An200]OUP12523.1 hypothetical protein B5F35_08245 [Anaeromassilibacillus sp. An200]